MARLKSVIWKLILRICDSQIFLSQKKDSVSEYKIFFYRSEVIMTLQGKVPESQQSLQTLSGVTANLCLKLPQSFFFRGFWGLLLANKQNQYMFVAAKGGSIFCHSLYKVSYSYFVNSKLFFHIHFTSESWWFFLFNPYRIGVKYSLREIFFNWIETFKIWNLNIWYFFLL